uniref:Uncharacterized protein n=1 Tax=Ditylenchus dipsaci TaxID=166011 RepID=A0A915E453_9BILA
MDFFTNAIILLSLLLICQWTSAKYDCENIKHKKARDSFLDTPKLQIIKNLFQQEDKKLQPTKTPLKEFEDAFKQTINFNYKDNKQIASYFVDEELPDSYSTILYHYEYKNFWKYVLHCEERGEKKKDEISTRFEEKEEDEDEGKKLSLNLVSARAGYSYLKLSYLRQMMEGFFRDIDYRYQLNPKYTKIVVQLEVKKDDEEAIDLYTKCGFIKTLQNVKENIIMKKIVQKKTKETQREITRHCKP